MCQSLTARKYRLAFSLSLSLSLSGARMAPFKMCRLPSRLGSRLHRFDYLSRKPGKISGKNDRFCPSLFLFCECEVGLGGVGRGWGGGGEGICGHEPGGWYVSNRQKKEKKKESISISSIVLSTLGHARVMRELATLDRADSILSARNRPGIGQESVDCFHSSRFPIRLCLSGRLARRL